MMQDQDILEGRNVGAHTLARQSWSCVSPSSGSTSFGWLEEALHVICFDLSH
ncbi:hypothetical protein LINPERPRIM_LOCUS33921 [Linum perenne]